MDWYKYSEKTNKLQYLIELKTCCIILQNNEQGDNDHGYGEFAAISKEFNLTSLVPN